MWHRVLYIILSLAFYATLNLWVEYEIAKVEEETFLCAFILKMCFTLFFSFSFHLTFLHNNSLPHNVMHFMVHHCNEKVFCLYHLVFFFKKKSSVRANEHSCNVLFSWREAKLCNFYSTLNLIGNEKVK